METDGLDDGADTECVCATCCVYMPFGWYLTRGTSLTWYHPWYLTRSPPSRPFLVPRCVAAVRWPVGGSRQRGTIRIPNRSRYGMRVRYRTYTEQGSRRGALDTPRRAIFLPSSLRPAAPPPAARRAVLSVSLDSGTSPLYASSSIASSLPQACSSSSSGNAAAKVSSIRPSRSSGSYRSRCSRTQSSARVLATRPW